MTRGLGRRKTLIMALSAPLLFGVVFAILPVQALFQAGSRTEWRIARRTFERDTAEKALARFAAGAAAGLCVPATIGLLWVLRRRMERRHQPATGPIGRNDPCPCGSGQKYKKCCLR